MSTTRRSEITKLDIEDDIPHLESTEITTYKHHNEEITQKIQKNVCCVDISSVSIEVLPACLLCKKPLVIVPGSKTVTCLHCKQTIKASKCGITFTCILTVDTVDNPLNLPLEILKDYLQIDVLEMCKTDLEAVKEKILFLENVYVVYNNKYIIISMLNHSSDKE